MENKKEASTNSKDMTGKKTTLSNLEENNSPHKVSLGNDYQYPIKGIDESRYKIDFGTSMKMKEVLYVPGLKKELTFHLCSISKMI